MPKVTHSSTNYSQDIEGESELDETARLPVLLRKSDVSNEAANDNEFSLSANLVERIEQLINLTESIERRLDHISESIDASPTRTRQAPKKKSGVSTKKRTAARKKKSKASGQKATASRKKKTTVTRKKKTSSSK